MEVLQMNGLSCFCNISHFMTTRHGGVSTENYASLNAGAYSGDLPERVQENRRLLAEMMGFEVEKLFAPYQVHEAEIRVLDQAFLSRNAEEQTDYLYGVDGVVTAEPGVCVAVATADCVPVLLYAPDKQVVAAVHAGWRGTVKGIVSQAVEVMVRHFGCDASLLHSGIGPSIGPLAFEVGEEVVEAFAASGRWTPEEMTLLVRRHPQTGKAHIDLWKANAFLLSRSGVPASSIEIAGICTYQNNSDFFSARRLGVRSGRILSGIFIR